jgi:hypothetical protein
MQPFIYQALPSRVVLVRQNASHASDERLLQESWRHLRYDFGLKPVG